MTKITYENQNGRKIGNRRGWDIDVRLDGKRVGAIINLGAGYRYKPITGKAGEIFPDLDACKQSLEGE
jgi:hypothetical protein